jgi:hypothetical protein
MPDGFVLLPQLIPGEAEQLAPEIGARSVADLRREAELRDLDSVPVIYSPTGGNKIPLADLRDLAQRIRRKAEASGYPDTERTERGRRDFDYAVAELLHARLQISVHEASKKAVWEFLTCILVPDVVRWRFWREDSATRQTRFVGGVKNTFRRLWRRAFVLYDPDSHNPYALMRFLLEDELVQIIERPQLSASRVLARSTVIAFRNSLARYSEVKREDLFRDAQKRLIRVMPIMCFEALDESLLERFLESIFDEAAGVLAPGGKTRGSEADGSGNRSEGKGMRGILRRLKGSGVGAGTQ